MFLRKKKTSPKSDRIPPIRDEFEILLRQEVTALYPLHLRAGRSSRRVAKPQRAQAQKEVEGMRLQIAG